MPDLFRPWSARDRSARDALAERAGAPRLMILSSRERGLRAPFTARVARLMLTGSALVRADVHFR